MANQQGSSRHAWVRGLAAISKSGQRDGRSNHGPLRSRGLPNINLGSPQQSSNSTMVATTESRSGLQRGSIGKTSGIERKGRAPVKQKAFITLMNFNPAAI
jgi:hypothetical protein